MTGQESTETLVCPACGTTNRPGSVFCAQCGAILDRGDDDAQATAAFTPLPDQGDTARENMDAPDAQMTQLFTPRAPIDAQRGAFTWGSPRMDTTAPGVPQPAWRGFVLGTIATVLILIVFGFFLWSTVASDGFRDAVTGFF